MHYKTTKIEMQIKFLSKILRSNPF